MSVEVHLQRLSLTLEYSGWWGLCYPFSLAGCHLNARVIAWAPPRSEADWPAYTKEPLYISSRLFNIRPCHWPLQLLLLLRLVEVLPSSTKFFRLFLLRVWGLRLLLQLFQRERLWGRKGHILWSFAVWIWHVYLLKCIYLKFRFQKQDSPPLQREQNVNKNLVFLFIIMNRKGAQRREEKLSTFRALPSTTASSWWPYTNWHCTVTLDYNVQANFSRRSAFQK